MPHGRHSKDERKEIRLGNFTLDGTSHQTWDAAFTPATPQDAQLLESQHRLTQQRATNESNNKNTLLQAKGHSAQPDMFWRTNHTKPRQKTMRVMALYLWGV
jgi:hypothetical protein